MKGAIGTSMGGSIIRIKRKKIKCDCKKCREYLRTNPLCRLNRNTSKTKYCKWFCKK